MQRHCPGAAKLDKASAHIGAVAFIHRFGSSLNTHVHFHVCAIDGVFEALEGDATVDPAAPPRVLFHPASGIDEAAMAQVQAQVRTRILRAFAGRGLIERFGVREMAVQAPTPEPPMRFPAHYLWAVLIARIYEVFPLVCPVCGGNMRLIAFITEGVQIRRILEHIGVDIQAPRIAPARGPPLWDECDAPNANGAGQGARSNRTGVNQRR